MSTPRLNFLLVFVVLGLVTLALGKELISGEKKEIDLIPNAVQITEDGFIPSSLTVKKGTVVRFLNKTDEWRWPASDLHPVHNLYPEFDPHKPIPPGEEWSFVFEKLGEWGMHDHLAPYIIGKIIVEE